jgi:hypothetical protein
MAIIKAVGFLSPKSMRNDGTGANVYDKATALAIGDVLEYMIPGGLETTNISLRSASSTMTFSVGIRPFKPESILVANPTYFAAAGQALTNGRRDVAVAAVKFDEDVVLTVTTAVAAGQVDVVLSGNANGQA